MSDEAIKKALECCIEKHCTECPIAKESLCMQKLREHALDLFNRQQAEIERLENAIIALMGYLDILGADKTDTSFIKQATEFNKQIRADIKSEAIKEFAELIVADYPEMEFYLEKLLAELVGGENA